MEKLALAAVSLAAVALIVLSVRIYVLAIRAQAAVDRLGRLVESELASAIRAWGEAARGVEKAARNLEEGFGSLGRTLGRVDRIGEQLEVEALALSVIQPAAAKVASWLGGVGKGLAEAMGQRREARGSGEGVETEVG